MGDNFNPNEWEEPTTQETQEDIEPIAWGKKRTGAVAIAIILLLIVICFFIRGCSISKRTNKSTVTESTNVVTESISIEDSSNDSEVTTEISENSTVEEDVESVSAEEITTEVLTEVSTTEVITTEQTTVEVTESEGSNENILIEVQEPALSDTMTVSGVVSGKSIYTINNNYLYEVRIILVMGNDQNVFCSYYCPRKTWDALSTGASLNVTYQVDSLGGISISTISSN